MVEVTEPQNEAYKEALEGGEFSAVLYRGTKGRELWSPDKGVDAGVSGRGTYFTPTESYASGFVEEGGELVAAEVTLKKPFTGNLYDYTSKFKSQLRRHAGGKTRYGPDYDKKLAEYIRRTLETQGYDGILLGNSRDGILGEVVVFHPEESVEVSASTSYSSLHGSNFSEDKEGNLVLDKPRKVKSPGGITRL